MKPKYATISAPIGSIVLCPAFLNKPFAKKLIWKKTNSGYMGWAGTNRVVFVFEEQYIVVASSFGSAYDYCWTFKFVNESCFSCRTKYYRTRKEAAAAAEKEYKKQFKSTFIKIMALIDI